MKRDLDLARRILQAVESSEADPRGWIDLDFVDEYPKNVVAYHVVLLADDGLIEAQDLMTLGDDGYVWMPKRLTAAGHDFLDAARQEDDWAKGKRLLEQAGAASFTLLKELLLHLGRQRLGLPD
ncbi:MAG: DUF2513 domain-containing protein [Chloroflexota bacterium]|nr:DUF2513 domain-containing protein [Chloroflexota bacterium]